MAEMVAEVKTLLVYEVCDKCKEGIMRPNMQLMYPTNPPQYPHICDKCGAVENFHTVYPYQRFVRGEDLREPLEHEKIRCPEVIK